jgi:Ca2+-binding EF-hand superfamily protein
MTRRYPFIALLGIALLGATFAFAGNKSAQTTTASPKLPNRLAIAEKNAKEMLLLMDTNKDGKISKAEWMKFMSQEFDLLDTDKSGYLNLKELEKSNITVDHVSPEVQGK